jgi:sugar O-acyltransferase (sialic acid O-acetyltransferase NeuD family)
MSVESHMESVIVIGAGGHARSVISVLLVGSQWSVAGLIDKDSTERGQKVLGFELLGGMECLEDLRRSGLTRAAIAIGDNGTRGRLANEIESLGFELVNVIHPAAHIMAAASIGNGAFIHANSVIGPGCRIGHTLILQPMCTIGHESVIGNSVQFCPGVHVGGKAHIGDHCFFGPGAVIYPGVSIGHDVSVGANSVIHRDLPNRVVVTGNPARLARRESFSKNGA